ncbi:hypothetical protein BsWGS_05998 [Bradybaena similaris]
MSLGTAYWTSNYRKLSLNLPASDIQRDQINILLCGPPGHGKSSTGNSILGSLAFSVSYDGEIETTTEMLHSTMYEHYKVKVVDCPPVPRVKHNNVHNLIIYCGAMLLKLLKLCPKGFHAAIIVLQYGKHIYPEEEYVLAMLNGMFGENFIEDHCICVVSRGDMFPKVTEKSSSVILPEDFNSWCREHDESSFLGRLFRACKYRCVLFDNFTDDMNIKTQQVNQLMSLIIDSWPKEYPLSMVSVNPSLRIKADIHVLVETASSFDQYQSQLKFVSSYTSNYQISPDTAKVCVMIFGQRKHERFDFSMLNNHEQLVETLYRAPFLEPSSGTDKALMFARQESFSTSGGTRSGVKQLLVMLTEGRCADQSKTIEEADQLKSLGVEIIIVGVATVNRATLMAIASEPTNVYIADNYVELQEHPKAIAEKTAEKAPQFKSTADILFILDSSGSISPEDYQKELDFVVYLTEYFNIGPNDVHFSVMVFSSIATMLFDFTLTSHDQVKKAIKAAPHMALSTDTAAALQRARKEAFTTTCGCRDGKKIAVIITDGCSDDTSQTEQAAKRLFESGVLTLAVGVGNYINRTELECIATLPEDVYTVDNYSVLETIKDELAGKTCKLETAMRNRV